jgi:hypothetical protein
MPMRTRKKKPGTVSRPGTRPQFQFPNTTTRGLSQEQTGAVRRQISLLDGALSGRATKEELTRPSTNANCLKVREVEMRKRLSGAALGTLLALAGALGDAAVAQNFPNHPMVMVIPFAAGGPQDVLGRIIGQGMSQALGQQVIIENVGGAGGMTGSVRVAQATPDGYIMVLGSVGTHAQNQTLYRHPL